MPVIPLTDPADERLADYRHLTDVALRRRIEPAAGLYMAEGAKVISTGDRSRASAAVPSCHRTLARLGRVAR